MLKTSSIIGAFAVSAVVAGSAVAGTYERVIPQSLYDRYEHTGSADSGRQSSNGEECSGFKDLISNGNVLKRMFSQGQGRTVVTASPNGGGTIGFNIEIATKGQALAAQECSALLR